MEYKILSLNEKSFTFASPPHSVCVKFVLVSKEFLEIDSNLQITVMTRLPDKYTHTHTQRHAHRAGKTSCLSARQ